MILNDVNISHPRINGLRYSHGSVHLIDGKIQTGSNIHRFKVNKIFLP